MAEQLKSKKINICEEAPVELILNGRKLVTFMCTPINLNELALGYLYSRGLIKKAEEVFSLAACEDMKKIYVITSNKYAEEEYSLSQVLESSCGSGVVFSKKFLDQRENDSNYCISIEELKEISTKMLKKAIMYKKMGGLHCACVANSHSILALREDIGRHNAVDKVIGKGLLKGVDFQRSVILTTGRISVDMVLKTVAANIPIIVSRSIPSTLGLEIAQEKGITIIGRIFSNQPIVYTHEHRINDEAFITKERSQKSICI